MCRPRHRHSIGKAPRLYGEPQSRASKVAQSSLSSCWKMLINVRPKSFRPRLGTPKEALRASSQGLRRHVLHLLRDLPHEVAAMLPASFPTFLSLGLAMSSLKKAQMSGRWALAFFRTKSPAFSTPHASF